MVNILTIHSRWLADLYFILWSQEKVKKTTTMVDENISRAYKSQPEETSARSKARKPYQTFNRANSGNAVIWIKMGESDEYERPGCYAKGWIFQCGSSVRKFLLRFFFTPVVALDLHSVNAEYWDGKLRYFIGLKIMYCLNINLTKLL